MKASKPAVRPVTAEGCRFSFSARGTRPWCHQLNRESVTVVSGYINMNMTTDGSLTKVLPESCT
jgi:hypothetical protein